MSTILFIHRFHQPFHQKPLILFAPEASFSFDNVALLPCQVMRPTVCQVLAPSQRMQVCTPSRDHREKEKRDEAFCAHHLFDDDRAFIAFSYSQPFHEMLRQLWNVRDTFEEAWISFMPQARDPTTPLDIFPPRTFFPRVTVLRDLFVSRASFKSVDEYFC